jgi:hypothetical protein
VAIVASAPAISSRRDRPRRTQTEHRGATGAVIVGGIGAGLAYLLYKDRGSSTTTPSGGSCASCGTGLTPPQLAPGLYETCSDPNNPETCTIWAVFEDDSGVLVRVGITTPAQLERCYGSNPVIVSTNPDFGNADTGGYLGTVGYVAAGCPCPNVPH